MPASELPFGANCDVLQAGGGGSAFDGAGGLAGAGDVIDLSGHLRRRPCLRRHRDGSRPVRELGDDHAGARQSSTRISTAEFRIDIFDTIDAAIYNAGDFFL